MTLPGKGPDMTATIHDPRACHLGEGAFWHPLRRQFFWFDIVNGHLLSQDRSGPRLWKFPEMVSAAGWVSEDVLLIAGERDLFLFDLETEEVQSLVALEADKPRNRSNDGRADRQGGFWIGTMAKAPAERKGAGAIYRFTKGELRLLFPGISIPNAICFSPDGTTAYFADTMARTIWSVALDENGWPTGDRQVFRDFTGTGIYPDGAVTDAAGNLWNAQWGASRVAAYAPDGTFLREVPVGAAHSSCPCFGGPDLTTLFCTTALEEMTKAAIAAAPDAGKVFVTPDVAKGLPEPQVLL
jgi:sugar lactone lactonase YvrE